MRCFSKFDDLEKAAILNSLNDHENKTEQDIFLQGFLKIETIKNRRPCKETPKSREYSVSILFLKTVSAFLFVKMLSLACMA